MTKPLHIASLDGVRGLAAIMVVICHLKMMLPDAHIPLAIEIGSQAVALFFTLSGFLMAVLYSDTPLTLESGARFLVSRFARIYPVYLFTVVLVIALSAIPSLDYFEPIRGTYQVLRHVGMIGSVGVFWSIGPEIQFYLLFPLFWFAMANSQRLHYAFMILLAAVAMAASLDFPGPGILITSKFQFFFGGLIIGRLYNLDRSQEALPTHGMLAVGAALFFFGYQTAFPAFATSNWGLETALLAAIIVFAAAKEHPISSTILAAAPLRHAGEISFSLYLLHKPVTFLIFLLVGDALHSDVLVCLAFAANIAVAVTTNRLIERPSRRAIVDVWTKNGTAILARLNPAGAMPHPQTGAE